jgi:eukaryotic-like serine/threonine-protein kinase
VAVAGLVLQNRYRLDAHIASGGVGEVWASTDLLLNRTVAVKFLRPEHAGDPELLTRFRAEAHHAGTLSHANIAQVYDYYEAPPPGQVYLVMEFVDGASLAWLLADGPLEPARTLDIIAQAARGLDAAHEAGVLHRDVKPGNLLIRHDGLVKLSDFGIARSARSTPVTRTGFLPGTPVYMAPERGTGVGTTPASDVYSLGIVAYECLTGRVPFVGGALEVALAHVEQELPPLPPTVPPSVAALVADLTSKDPAARPSAADVAAWADELRAQLSGSPDATGVLDFPPVPAAEGSASPARPTSRFSRPVVIAPLALSGIAAIGLIAWVLAVGSAPTTHPSPNPAATAGPGHHSPRRGQAAVPAQATPAAAPVASHSPRPRASRSTSPAASPSAVPTSSPTAGSSPTPQPSPGPSPSSSPTAPANTPPPSQTTPSPAATPAVTPAAGSTTPSSTATPTAPASSSPASGSAAGAGLAF